jgi:hypothetical protein
MSALVYLVCAGMFALLVERLWPSGVPWAAIALLLAGITGGVLAALTLGDQGPHLADVAVAPAAGGALLGVLLGRLAVTRAARGALSQRRRVEQAHTGARAAQSDGRG